ncbi:MAG TPA: hypothetical protein VIL37_08765 [Natronosporangium sp.]
MQRISHRLRRAAVVLGITIGLAAALPATTAAAATPGPDGPAPNSYTWAD